MSYRTSRRQRLTFRSVVLFVLAVLWLLPQTARATLHVAITDGKRIWVASDGLRGNASGPSETVCKSHMNDNYAYVGWGEAATGRSYMGEPVVQEAQFERAINNVLAKYSNPDQAYDAIIPIAKQFLAIAVDNGLRSRTGIPDDERAGYMVGGAFIWLKDGVPTYKEYAVHVKNWATQELGIEPHEARTLLPFQPYGFPDVDGDLLRFGVSQKFVDEDPYLAARGIIDEIHKRDPEHVGPVNSVVLFDGDKPSWLERPRVCEDLPKTGQ